VFLARVFDAAQTIRKDVSREHSVPWGWMTSDKLKDWYEGGNDKYPPGFPTIPFRWGADFWHTCKFGWIYSWSIALGFACISDLTVWQAAIVGIIAQGVEGTTFHIFYSKIFRK
jgi:hypothetical protein